MDASGMGSGSVSAVTVAAVDTQSDDTPIIPAAQVVTTREELEAFYTVKAILRDVIEPSRVADNDVLAYFGVLLDGKVGKPICRFYFNTKNKHLALFDPSSDKNKEERIPIAQIDDLYQYSDRLKQRVLQLTSVKTEKSAAL